MISEFLSPTLERIAPYVPGEQPQDQHYIKLNTNESPYLPSPLVQAAVGREIKKLNLYSDPTCRGVIQPLANLLGVAPEQVFVSNGSDETLAFCFQGFCKQGAAFADLTYGFYKVYAQLYALQTHVVPLRKDFAIEPEDYAGLGKTIFIANPNAPTGLALTLLQVEQILKSNPTSLVVIDEAYVDFGAQSTVPLLTQHSNLLVVGTFSKSRSLAGARLGYAVGSPELIADLNRIKFSFNPYNVNRMTLAAGAAAIEDKMHFEACRKKIIETRARTVAMLLELGFECTESLANFVFASHPNYRAEKLYARLRQRDILVRWFDQHRAQNYLRITIGTDEEMAMLGTTLKDILKTEER